MATKLRRVETAHQHCVLFRQILSNNTGEHQTESQVCRYGRVGGLTVWYQGQELASAYAEDQIGYRKVLRVLE